MDKVRIIPKLLQKSTWMGVGVIVAAIGAFLSKDPTVHLALSGTITAILGGIGLILTDDVTTKPAAEDSSLPAGGGS